MFEGISFIAHIIALFWCFLLFSPANKIRWGWLWYAQILATEWGFGTLGLSLVLISVDATTAWFFLAFLLYLFQRSYEFRSSHLNLEKSSWRVSLKDLILQNVWPFRAPPPGQPFQMPEEKLIHQRFHKSSSQKVCLHIHGGAWIHGDATQLTYTANLLFQSEYETISINYRKHPEHSLPEIMESVSETFQNLCHHYGHQQKFLVYGRSAGGHLALMLAKRFPEQVSAVVALYPVTDFITLDAAATDSDILKTKTWIQNLFLDNSAMKTELSPSNNIPAQMPPVLIAHGENDPVVPIQQSDLLYEALQQRTTKFSYLKFNFGTHGFDGFSGGLSMCVFKRALQRLLKSL